MPTTPIKLSPSDLTFLWDECPRCFYLKYINGISRPAAPFPAIFGTIDRLMKAHYAGHPTADLDPSLPPGYVSFAEQWVESVPVTLPGHDLSCYLKGKFDTLVSFDDGSYGVVDFKTSEPKPDHIPFYSRQLHAYAYALEHAVADRLALSPISRLGLLVAAPHGMLMTDSGEIVFQISPTWLEVPRQDDGFVSFLDRVLTLLELLEPPPAAEKCTFCQYRQHAREHGM